MRIKTRSGVYTIIPEGLVISQEKRVLKNETYYILYLKDGRKVSVSEPIEGVRATNTKKFKVGENHEQGNCC